MEYAIIVQHSTALSLITTLLLYNIVIDSIGMRLSLLL